MFRANAANYGDLQGPLPNYGLKSGSVPVTKSGDKLVGYAIGLKDIEMSKETVNSVEQLSSEQVNNVSGFKGKSVNVTIYKVEFKNGDVGKLRLVSDVADKLIGLIK